MTCKHPPQCWTNDYIDARAIHAPAEGHSMRRAPRSRNTPPAVTITLAVVVALVLWAASCASVKRAAVAGGAGSAAGGLVVVVVGGPVGIAVGVLVAAITSHYTTTTQAPENQTNINVGKGGTAHVGDPGPTLLDRAGHLALALLVIVNHRKIWYFFKTLTTGGWKAAWLNLLSMIFGGAVSDKAKQATAFHAMQRDDKKKRKAVEV